LSGTNLSSIHDYRCFLQTPKVATVIRQHTTAGDNMPILNTVAQMLAKPFPRVISPKTHVVVDYINVGVLLMSGAWFWQRNKRAALGALVGGGAVLVLNLLTGHPGAAKNVISFQSRREIDLGLAAMISTMPEFFAFKSDEERKFFIAEGVLIAVVTELTQFPDESNPAERKRFRAA
jgi:hypothetical protein